MDRIICVRQWTVRQEIPVERIFSTRGRVGSDDERGRVGGVRVESEGGVEDEDDINVEGSVEVAVEGLEGAEEEEGGSRGSSRIFASMGRSVDSTNAVKIYSRQANHESRSKSKARRKSRESSNVQRIISPDL